MPKAGKETVTVSLAGPTASVPFKKMSAYGGDHLSWSADGKTVSWSWGTKLYRQNIGDEKPETYDITVEAPRAKPKGTVVLSGARIVTMKGDEIIEKGDIVVTITASPLSAPRLNFVPSGAKLRCRRQDNHSRRVDVHVICCPPRDLPQTQGGQYLANLATASPRLLSASG